MLEDYNLEHILFLDIETVPVVKKYDMLSDSLKKLWDKKSQYFRKADELPENVYDRAGIYAEFGKIVCISLGFIHKIDGVKCLRIKSLYNDDEKLILMDFISLLNTLQRKYDVILCAHNGKEFDFPYIARRILINTLKLPKALEMAGKKPWEIKHLDTLDLWKFGDYKHYTSLNLLTEIFSIPTPKDDIDGSQVASVYWDDSDLKRIKMYCEKDVVALTQLFLKLKSEEIINKENIQYIE